VVGIGVINQAAVSGIHGDRAPRCLWRRDETNRLILLSANHGRHRRRARVESGRLQYRTRFKAINEQDERDDEQDRFALAFMILPVSLFSYFDLVSDALATFAADACAAVSSTTTVIFMPAWPSPQ
jgi:hypothetical protein